MSDATHLKNILILDDDADFRKLLITILGKKFEGVEITEYDPVAKGKPGENFNWSKFDVLLLDYFLAIPGTTGLDILQNNRKNRLFPATIMLTGAGNEEIAVRAVKAGVYDYLRKESLDKDRLHSAILDAFEKNKVERDRLNELTSQSHAFNKALFYQELEQRGPDKKNRVLVLIELDKHDLLEERLGIIFRDNIIRHIAKQSFEVLKLGDCNPSITRFGDTSVALLIDEPKTRNNLEFNLGGLCAHLEKHPYKYDGKNIRATVSMGALCLSDKELNAEEYIRHAMLAAAKASADEGDSFYLYGETDWEAVKDQPVSKGVMIEDDQKIVETQPGKSEQPAPVTAAAEPAPVAESAVDSSAPVETEAKADIPSTHAPGPAESAGSATKPETVSQTSKPDPRELAELMQKIKTAFEDKRAVQTFQPVISLTEQEGSQSVYLVSVQLINKDGTIMPRDELQKVATVPAFRKFLDRWMLREIIGRIVSRNNEDDIFIMNISDDSIADATFFNWLRKLLKGLDKNNPGKQIVLEISAREIPKVHKQSSALMSFFKKSHGFRFILGKPTDIKELQNLSETMKFDLVRTNYDTITELNTTISEASGKTDIKEKLTLLQKLKKSGIHFFTDDVEDATRLTEAISVGADYAAGLFIGEPMNQLDDVTNVESFEII